MLWIHRWIGDRIQAHLPSLRSASDCFELVAIWSRSREAAEALRGDRQDDHVQILYGEDTLRGMEIDPVGGGRDKKSVWDYAYYLHIPYEMGGQLDLELPNHLLVIAGVFHGWEEFLRAAGCFC